MGNLRDALEAKQPNLETCPFCGRLDAEVEVTYIANAPPRWWVECAVCECRGPDSPTKERAANAWNNRSDAVSCSHDWDNSSATVCRCVKCGEQRTK